jgi:hypothetical protein
MKVYPNIDLNYATIIGNDFFPRETEHCCLITTLVRKLHTDSKYYLIPIVQRVNQHDKNKSLQEVIKSCV